MGATKVIVYRHATAEEKGDTGPVKYVKIKDHNNTEAKVPTVEVLANVAFTGSYNDLKNKPEIPEGKEILTEDLYTYYSIGKITASTTSPAKIGSVGDSVLGVLKNIVSLDRKQPASPTQPTISIEFTTTSAEYGTHLTSIGYTLKTTPGSYTYGPATGVTFSKYYINDTEVSSKTGTLVIDYTVGTSSAVSYTVKGTHSAGAVAYDNAGDASNPVKQITAGDVSSTASMSVRAIYNVYTATGSTTAPTT